MSYQDVRARIQQQEAAADQLLAQLNAPQEQPQPPADPTPAPVATVDPTPEPVQDPAPAPVQPAPAPAVDWEHKYKTLQGIHNSHTADMKDRIRRLEAALQAREQPETKKPEAPEVDTKKDAEVFGEDLVQMVVRIVDSKFGRLVSEFDDRLKVIEDRYKATTETVHKTAKDLFLDRLTARIPDLEAINTSPAFLEWLAELDPVSGYVRQDILDHAAGSLDLERVVGIFTAFKKTQAPAPAPATTSAKQQLERQVAPRTSAPATVPDTPRIYDQSEVVAFYDDLRRGNYRGREALAKQIEAELNKALEEGRVR